MTSSASIFDFRSYKDYLRAKAGPRNTRLGVRGSMARALRCQPSYISQVLYGAAHFSLEQGDTLAEFCGLSEEETHYFMLLIQKERAGTKKLEKYFTDQLEGLLAKRLVITERLGTRQSLTEIDQSVYYSSWHYAAIHIGLTVPALRSPEALAEYFHVPLKRVSEVLDFLLRTGLARRQRGKGLEAGEAQLRLGNASHNIIRLHTHWRNQAIESLEREALTDLHYSAAFSLSRADVVKLKDRILEFMKDANSLVRQSAEEEVHGFCIDFFSLRK